MSLFDRAHTSSYSTLKETVSLSCTVFEIKPVICRMSPILTHPTCIWRSWRNFVELMCCERALSAYCAGGDDVRAVSGADGVSPAD